MGLLQVIKLHLISNPADLGGGAAFVVPDVLIRRHASNAPTEPMDRAVTPDGVIRNGLAHGTLTDHGSDLSSTRFSSPLIGGAGSLGLSRFGRLARRTS
jgi:hypothetical protein